MDNKLIVSSSPHLRAKDTTQTIMLDVIIALMPAAIASIVIFGYRSFVLLMVCVLSCVLSEYVCRKVMKRDNTIFDLSAVVTGVLLAMNLPVSLNPIIAAFGGVIAIVVVKQMFGGIGQNFVNPALTARIVLMNSFPAKMTTWTAPFAYRTGADAVTTATPLGILAEGGTQTASYMDLFLGNCAGCLGETSALALIIGGVYLVVRKVICPCIPCVYIGTTAVMALLMGRDPLFEVLAGGLLLGAIFMATDYATSPIHLKGRIVYAIGCGVITMLIRAYGSLAEGVSYSIIIMNILVPLIENATMPRAFGKEKKKK